MEYELEDKILEFAKKAHEGQRRKYTAEPYWHHVAEVAQILKTVYHTEEQLYAAYLHDVIEDTKFNRGDIVDFLYSEGLNIASSRLVGGYVLGLSDVSKPEDGNRAARKQRDRIHLAEQPYEVKTIKLADIISNTKSIIQYDKKFAKTYIPEKISLLEVLKDSDYDLYRKACYEVEKAGLALEAE